ncbi:MAG: ATP-binding protein [Pseudomonadota bacterium]
MIASPRRLTSGDILTGLLFLMAVAAGIATYIMLVQPPTVWGDTNTLLVLLNLDLALTLALLLLIGRRIFLSIRQHRRADAGARLHTQLLITFGIVTALPALILALFSALFFYFGVQTWFSERVEKAVNQSLSVAQAYLDEHQRNLHNDLLAMANDINDQSTALQIGEIDFNEFITTQAILRGLSEAMVISSRGDILARAQLTLRLQFESLEQSLITQAREGGVLQWTSPENDRVRTLVQLRNIPDTFLIIGRDIEQQVIQYMQDVIVAEQEFRSLQEQTANLQIRLTIIYLTIAALLVLASMWWGMRFAERLAEPIARLIGAANLIRIGRLGVTVQTPETIEDLRDLTLAFNRMSEQLKDQRDNLITTHKEQEERRRFTETILAGVTSGVLALDHKGVVQMTNSAANKMIKHPEVIGQPIHKVVPELAALLPGRAKEPAKPTTHQVKIQDADGTHRWIVSTSAIYDSGTLHSYVMTFDDVTDLLTAQRAAAWSDMARRIAHEVKNPLTPIQLAAERLQKRLDQDKDLDIEIARSCIDTILRQVMIIGRLVGEFSAFARMPEPSFAPVDLIGLIKDVAAVQATAFDQITIRTEIPKDLVTIEADEGQLTQVLNNVIDNARQGIERSERRGEIVITVMPPTPAAPNHLTITIQDNGVGLPPDMDVDRLTEPYMTTREGGIGVGLAIVQKIIQDHKGSLTLRGHHPHGTLVSMRLPLRPDGADE